MGSRAERARFAFIPLDEDAWSISEMCAALHVARRGCRVRKKRPPSAHDLRDTEPIAAISEIYAAGCGIRGAPQGLRRVQAVR